MERKQTIEMDAESLVRWYPEMNSNRKVGCVYKMSGLLSSLFWIPMESFFSFHNALIGIRFHLSIPLLPLVFTFICQSTFKRENLESIPVRLSLWISFAVGFYFTKNVLKTELFESELSPYFNCLPVLIQNLQCEENPEFFNVTTKSVQTCCCFGYLKLLPTLKYVSDHYILK